jgi:hypothetical protein
MNRRHRALLRAIAPLLLMGVIFYLSGQSSTGEHPWWEVIIRKLGHVSGYALLTALCDRDGDRGFVDHSASKDVRPSDTNRRRRARR